MASRREGDKLVESGFVWVNKKRAENGMLVQEGDEVLVKGPQKQYQYLAYYKPKGLATHDLAGKKSVITEWQKKGLYPVGRLDKESEGLLILTNDGRFTREVLTGSKYQKEYIVTVKEPLRAGVVKIFKSGMETKIGKLLPAKAEILNKHTLRVVLNEGKRHQIRVMLNELRYTVVSLKRVAIGQIKIRDLKPGETREFKNGN